MPFNLTAHQNYLKKISIFQNEKQFYFIGTHELKKTFCLFTFNKLNMSEPNSQNFTFNDLIMEYSEKTLEQFEELNNNLSKDISTNLRYLLEAKGIYGFFTLTFGYYAILITEISKVGKVGSHIINRIDKIRILPLFVINDDQNSDTETKYLNMFKDFMLCGQTYFSYTYDVTKSIQRNFIEYSKDTYSKPNSNEFYWNKFHIEEFDNAIKNKLWINNCIYGYFEQINCIVYGLRFNVTIIARRNRHYSGTRYLKRGISDDGYVGNDVETEQILEEISTSTSDTPIISSYVHIRGSVPISWYQIKNKILPKPDIKINYSDVFFKSRSCFLY